MGPSTILPKTYSRKIITATPVKLPKDLDQQHIEAKITRPITSYTLDSVIPDQ